MIQHQKQQIDRRLVGSQIARGFPGNSRKIGMVTADLLNACAFELPLDSQESKINDSWGGQREITGDTDCESSDDRHVDGRRRRVQWRASGELSAFMNCSEFEMGNNCLDKNNSGQGVDMQNLPSIAEQIERQRTWMTIYFRYRMNWYEAKTALAKMPREVAYKTANLPLWTRYVKVQLHRKTIFLNAVRAFRNRMQCATSGVRFTMNAFYRDSDKKGAPESKDGLEPKPLPYFKCPDDMPDIKTMVVAQMNVFVSNSTCFFDQFWDESLKASN